MKRFLMLFLTLALFVLPTTARELFDEQSERIGTPRVAAAVPDAARTLMENGDPAVERDLGSGIVTILKRAIAKSDPMWKSAAATSAMMMAVAVLTSFLSGLGGAASGRVASLAGALALSAACFQSVNGMIGIGARAIDEMSVFSQALLPTIAAASAASGTVTSASALYVATVIFMNLLVGTIRKLLLPLVYAFLAVSTAEAALSKGQLRPICELIDWSITNFLKLILLVFTAYLSVSGVISGRIDATTVKATKLTIAATVPVVGSMISDASETVLLGAGLLKSSVGVFGMLSVIAICTLPFLQLGINYLIFKLTAAMCGAIGEKNLTNLTNSIADAIGFLLAMTGCCGIMTLVSCVLFMKVNVT